MDRLKIPEFRRGYAFDWKFPEDSSRVVSACVVEDEIGEPLALAAAELVPEITLAMNQELHPHVRLRAGTMIHEFLLASLSGYPEMICHVPPELERGYGRHLERMFGWQPMWKGYKLRKNL